MLPMLFVLIWLPGNSDNRGNTLRLLSGYLERDHNRPPKTAVGFLNLGNLGWGGLLSKYTSWLYQNFATSLSTSRGNNLLQPARARRRRGLGTERSGSRQDIRHAPPTVEGR